MNSNSQKYRGSSAIIPYKEIDKPTEKIPHEGEKITSEAPIMGLQMAFSPSLTRTIAELERFEDMNIDDFRRTIRGLIIDVEGTLTCGDDDFTPEVVEKLREIRAKMPACIYCNDTRNWSIFEQLSIPVAKHLPNKPDSRGFMVALQMHLNPMQHGTRPIHPQEVAMIGDNRITDGGCRKVGMQFILVKRTAGPEKSLSKFTRLMGNGIAGFHRQLERIGQKVTRKKLTASEPMETPSPLVKALYEKRAKHKLL